MWPFGRRAAPAAATSARVSESAATDHDAWLRDKPGVGPQGGSGRDLPPYQRVQAVRKSRYEYDKSPIYGGVLDRFIDFVLGDGIVIKAKSEQVDLWLQKQLERGWYGRERRHVEALFVDGERLLVVRAPSRGDSGPIGEVRIGTMDVLEIQKEIVNLLDQEDLIALQVRTDRGGDLTLPLVRDDGDVAPANVLPSHVKERPMWVLGAFLRVNQRGVRGIPALLRTLDHASDLDNLVANLVAQLEYVRRLWLHAKVAMSDDTGTDGKPGKFAKLAADIKAWATSWQNGEVLVTSGGKEGVVVDTVAPKMELADAKALYDVVLEMCLGGHGIPKMWFGSGGETNRATAAEQGTPIFRAIQSRQAEVRAGVESMVRAVLTMGQAAGVAGVTADAEVEVTMATVATRDSERDVREIAALGATLAIAVDRGAITEQEAAQILRDTIKSKTFGAKLTAALPAPVEKPVAPPVNDDEDEDDEEEPPPPSRAAEAAPAPQQINVHVTTPPPPAPLAPAAPPPITIHLPAPSAPTVRVRAGDVIVKPADQPAPRVNVEVRVPEQVPPRVDVQVNVPAPQPQSVSIVRDKQGRISGTKIGGPGA